VKPTAFIRNVLLPSGYPPYIIFFVTARCNMKCKHCFYWQDISGNKNELSIEEIEKMSRALPDMFFIRITGGEPFLRKDLYQIVGSFYRNNSIRRIGITTNGLLTDEIAEVTSRIAGNFKDLCFDIGISIDNLNEKHDAIRSCPGAFNKAMNTYDELMKLKEKNANVSAGFLITMMKDNQNELKDIYQYLKSKCPDGMGLNIVRGGPKDSSQLDVDIEKYDEFRHLINEYNFRNYSGRRFSFCRMRAIKTVMSQDTIINTVKKKKAQFVCPAGEKIAVLYPDGNVSACEMLDSTIGNIRDYNYDFKQLWRANKRKTIVRGIKKTKCFCTHECFVTAGLIFRLKNLFKIMIKTCLSRLP